MRGSGTSDGISAARQMARAALSADIGDFDLDVTAKAKICLLDFLSCAFEAKDHAWSKQAIGLARPFDGGATVIGTQVRTTPGDAAFANATLGHGLVREDMHAGSICHHGVVIWPALLALSERSSFSGAVLLAAAIVGYEVGAQTGKTLFTADLARLFRPTGIVAPLGAALAGSRALGLSEDAAICALSIAANTSSGLNEWPHTGGSEMYFHPGFAARNAIAAIELAEAGAYASETILEGEAGLFAAYRRQPMPGRIRLFEGEQPEIMAVYNKPVPACNFAQTAAQAALQIARESTRSGEIVAVAVRVPAAAIRYPRLRFDGALSPRASSQDEYPVQRCRHAGPRYDRRRQLCWHRRPRDPAADRNDRSGGGCWAHGCFSGSPRRRGDGPPAQRRNHPPPPG